MTEKAMASPQPDRAIQLADLVGLIASIVIVVAYLLFPLRSDNPGNGFTFIYDVKSWNYPFSALTLIVGVVGIVSALVCLMILRERAVRWWFAMLGALGLAFVIDNTLGGSPALAVGGWLAALGCLALIVQVILPRHNAATDARANDALLGIVRIGLGTLWFTQLLWKLPWNNYGCAAGPLAPGGSTGLCYWIGQEIAQPRWPLYHDFLQNLIAPNMNVALLPIFLMEAFITISLLLGLFTRLGAFAGVLQALNLFIGLSAIRGEWDWTYLMLTLLCAVFISVGGRFVGLDALLYARLKKLADSGSSVGRWLVKLV
ncbi:MAG TPA: TQO small subunit DoxD [Aggregatilineales bacterium]|nr:TQO small subunit DoxD [Aggregatilineales bacterium]